MTWISLTLKCTYKLIYQFSSNGQRNIIMEHTRHNTLFDYIWGIRHHAANISSEYVHVQNICSVSIFQVKQWILINLRPKAWLKWQQKKLRTKTFNHRSCPPALVCAHGNESELNLNTSEEITNHRREWPRIYIVHETTQQSFQHITKVSLGTRLWIFSTHHCTATCEPEFSKERRLAAYMAAPASSLEPDELEKRQRLELAQSSATKTQVSIKNWRTVKQASNALISDPLLMLFINHIAHKVKWIVLPNKSARCTLKFFVLKRVHRG